MPSSQKTNHIQLNLWNGTDKPKRADFNADNEKIDSTFKTTTTDITAHKNNNNIHITQDERNKWNLNRNFAIASYTGTGAGVRNISLGKQISFGMIYAVGKPPIDLTPNHKVYSGNVSNLGCSEGLSLTSNGFAVENSAMPDPLGRVFALNESGVVYVCIYWV